MHMLLYINYFYFSLIRKILSQNAIPIERPSAIEELLNISICEGVKIYSNTISNVIKDINNVIAKNILSFMVLFIILYQLQYTILKTY